MSETTIPNIQRERLKKSKYDSLRFLGKTAAVGAVATLIGVGIVKNNTAERPITERPHKEFTMKKSTDRLWNIGERAFPGQDPRESSYDIAQDQPEGFDAGKMQVGDIVYLEPDAKIGKLVDPSKS